MSTLSDYISYELTQAVASGLNKLFPRLNFRERGNTWFSKFDIDGNNRGKDTLFVYKNNPLKIHSQQGDKWDIIDLFSGNGRPIFEAVTEIANILGIMPPPDNKSGEWEKYRENQKKLEEAHNYFISYLWGDTEGAKEALNYLRGRGWSDEEIKKAKLGYISTELKANLPVIDYTNSEGQVVNMFYPSFVGSTHKIVIPVFQRGNLRGFKVRTTDPNESQKYKNIGFLKRNGIYDLTPYNSSSENCILVEGDLDALHAIVKGAKGVCSTLGGALSQDQAQDAIKRGYKHYILFFDNDEAGVKFTFETISTLENLGQRVYVVDFEEAKDNTLKDPDEIISKFGIEEFTRLIKYAINSWRFKAQYLVDKATKENNNEFTFIAFDDLKRECISLLKEYPEHREEIIKYLLPVFGGEGAEATEDVRRQIEKAEAEFIRENEAKRQATQVSETLEKVSKLQAQGRTKEAAEILNNFKDKVKRSSRNFAADFADKTPAEYKQLLAEQPDGHPTGLVFETEQNNYRDGRGIAVPYLLEQGVSFVCASTGHGKTSFLNMLALNETTRLLKKGDNSRVLYFSFEVNKRLMLIDLLNNFVNDSEISADSRISPQKTLLAYFKGDKEAISGKYMTGTQTTHRLNFEVKQMEFFSRYLKTLKLVYCDYDVTELIEAIKHQYESTGGKVSAVFIDYAQLLYKEGDERLQRYEQIKSIVDDLNKLAQSLNIPIVCAAQFNQSKEEPITMSEKNIGEGSDFSKIATSVIGLFNLDKIDPTTTPPKQLSALNRILGKFGLSPIDESNPMPKGYFLVKLLKCRNDVSNISTILKWNGANKHLYINYPDEINPTQPKQGNLLEDELNLAPVADEDLPF